MSVEELNKEQMTELKCNYYCNVIKHGQDVSYSELANIDDKITDEEMYEQYADTVFVEDDFFCSMANKEIE